MVLIAVVHRTLATSMAFLEINLLRASLLMLVLELVKFELIALLLGPLCAPVARSGKAQFLAV